MLVRADKDRPFFFRHKFQLMSLVSPTYYCSIGERKYNLLIFFTSERKKFAGRLFIFVKQETTCDVAERLPLLSVACPAKNRAVVPEKYKWTQNQNKSKYKS